MDAVFATAREEMERHGVPGAAVGVWHGGDERCEGFGVTSVENPLDVTPETLFQIGSITKTMTAAVVMRLVEDALLELDTPLRTYLPELRLADEDVAARVTMRHALTHTGGWLGDFFDDFGLGDDALSRMVAKFSDLPQQTPLGEIWSYNNSGFYLAGRAVEAVTGKTYEENVEAVIFEPLEMRASYFFPHDVMTHRFAVGHQLVGEDSVVARPWPVPRASNPAGGITSTVGDLLRYARGHVDGAGEFLRRETIELMWTPLVAGGVGGDHVGLAWMIRESNGMKILGHGGTTNGQQALLQLVPEARLAVAVLTNHARGAQVCVNTAYAALEFAGIDPPRLAPAAEQPDLDEYLGRYAAHMSDVELTLEDGSLTLNVIPKGGFPKPDSPPYRAPPPAPVAFYERDKIFVEEGPLQNARGDFIRGDGGSIAWLRFGGRVHART